MLGTAGVTQGRLLVLSKEPLVRWRPKVLGGSLHLENCESLFARITNSTKGADDADAREHDYEDEDNEQPDGIHVFILSGAPACAGKWNGQRNRQQTQWECCDDRLNSPMGYETARYWKGCQPLKSVTREKLELWPCLGSVSTTFDQLN